MAHFELLVPTTDPDVLAVRSELLKLDPDGTRTAQVLRKTFDQLYDGQNTGRYCVDQLFKTEKTHFGTLIEINLQRRFAFTDGDKLDFSIAGHEVDCKYSHTGQWMLPQESFDEIVMVIRADDRRSRWSLGLVRVTAENRRTSENRDRKTGLNQHGRDSICWVFNDEPMPPNALLRLDASDVAKIMSARSGQARINELFRRVTNRRITRNIVATVAQQSDYMKRVRANGGARGTLRPEGYLILSGDFHNQAKIATQLGAVTPTPGELVSVRVVPATSDSGIKIANDWWRLATPDDKEIVVPAPEI